MAQKRVKNKSFKKRGGEGREGRGSWPTKRKRGERAKRQELRSLRRATKASSRVVLPCPMVTYSGVANSVKLSEPVENRAEITI
jgi:hypothetical protein